MFGKCWGAKFLFPRDLTLRNGEWIGGKEPAPGEAGCQLGTYRLSECCEGTHPARDFQYGRLRGSGLFSHGAKVGGIKKNPSVKR